MELELGVLTLLGPHQSLRHSFSPFTHVQRQSTANGPLTPPGKMHLRLGEVLPELH